MVKQLRIALCLPALDIEALLQNKTIIAMSRISLRPGREFALYPVNFTPDRTQQEYYNPDFLKTANEIIKQPAVETISIQAWAKCEKCEILSDRQGLEILSQLTIWTKAALEKTLSHSSYLFLAYLRVYQLSEAIAFPSVSDAENKLGKIAGISQPLAIAESYPVFSDEEFSQQCQRLETRQLPSSTQPKEQDIDRLLDEVQDNFTSSQAKKPKEKTGPPDQTHSRDRKLIVKAFDFVSSPSPQTPIASPKTISPTPETPIAPPENALKLNDNNLEWIAKIAEIGNSSNGHEFERIVRKSLIFLGFRNSNENSYASLDPESTGGPGGLDFYTEEPYPVVGECKATKTEKIPSETPHKFFGLIQKFFRDEHQSCLKVIMAAGELTSDSNQLAIGHKMNVIRPETLQKLVQLKALFPGTIDLFFLKFCLEREPFGEAADRKVNEYCDRVITDLKLRSQLVKTIEQLQNNTGSLSINIDSLHGAYYSSNQPLQHLKPYEMHEILIELSSSLTGYLGREKGKEWRSDRFYFLRDLTLENF